MPLFSNYRMALQQAVKDQEANTLKSLSKDERYFPSAIDYMLPHYSFVRIWFFLLPCEPLLIIS